MEEKLLWDIVLQNAYHIETINKELGGVLTSLQWIRAIMICQISMVGVVLAGVISNILLTRRNGRK